MIADCSDVNDDDCGGGGGGGGLCIMPAVVISFNEGGSMSLGMS